MWSRLFRAFSKVSFTKRAAVTSATLPPVILWFLPDWLKQGPLREEDVEPDPLLLVLKKAKLAEIRKEFVKSADLYHEGLKMLHDQYEAGQVDDKKFVLFRIHIYDMMANAAFARNDFVTAESLFKTCVQGFVNELGYSPSDLAVVEVSLKLSIIYACLGRRIDAETGYSYCLETMEKLQSVKNLALKSEVKSVTSPSANNNETPELSDEDRNALALYGMCLDSYGRFLIESFRYDDAVAIARKALAVCSKVFDQSHPTRLSVVNLLGNALFGAGQADKAEAVFRECVNTAKKALDDEIALRNAAIQIEGSLVEDDLNEQLLARALCACQCNCANTIFRINLASAEQAADREMEARKFCFAAKLIADKYKDEACSKEVRSCLAKFHEISQTKTSTKKTN